jgi:uncharacterized ferritin-like protein (DUF455 family)
MGRLREEGIEFGTIPVHKGLFENIKKSEHCLAIRLALNSIVSEGKGLDAGERLIKKLKSWNDMRSVAILEVILEEEVGHIAFGRKWFEIYVKEILKRDFLEFFKEVRNSYETKSNLNLNVEARKKAGFDENWLVLLKTEGFVEKG